MLFIGLSVTDDNSFRLIMRYHTIVLAPHLDDAALSCGAHIATLTGAGHAVLVLTVMAGDPPAGPLSPLAAAHHERWQVDGSSVAARRDEDRRACALLGADYRHESVPDCIYRRDPRDGTPLYATVTDFFGRPHPAEAALTAELAEQLRALPAHERLSAPLGVGGHVDHQIVRRAAEQAAGTALLYYEDYPYAQQPAALAPILAQDGPWEALLLPVDAAALTVKVAAIAAYESQLSTFFQDAEDLERQVRSYTSAVGGERLWRRRPVT
jgi:LmbE family N-acetylglucosaminyl deacetylase